MKFQPLEFIEIASKNGVTLTRIDKNIRVRTDTDTVDYPLWVKAVNKHKRRLINHLPDDETTRIQLDIFIDFNS